MTRQVRPLELKAVRGRQVEHQAFALKEVKAIDGQGLFEGYLAVFNNLDDNGDVIEPGSFKKTLRDAYEVKSRSNTPFLYPLLWMHDDKQFPAGGFTDMSEDSHGLYVKGRCDLNTEMGRNVFSGMQMGYINGLSIGYYTIRAQRDAKTGSRHIQEIKLLEGSAITVTYQANQSALVLATKGRGGRVAEYASASGKTSWPLAERDMAWDEAAAHKNIVAWATDEDDKLDQAKMKSVHLWYDDSAPDQITSYKLLYCDVVNGAVKAIPKGIFACTGAHGIQAIKSVSSGDMSSIKSKLKTMYGRMAKEFSDDSIVVPWEQKRSAILAALREQKSMSGLQILTYGLSTIDDYGDFIDSWLERIGDVCGLDLDPDEGFDDAASVGEQMAAAEIPGMAVHPVVKAVLDTEGVREGLIAIGNAFQKLDDAVDSLLTALGMNDDDEDESRGYGYMSVDRPSLELKVSRSLSKANREQVKEAMGHVMKGHQALQSMLSNNDSSNMPMGGNAAKKSLGMPPLGSTQSELSATTAENTSVEPGQLDTTLQEMVDFGQSLSSEAALLEIFK